MLSGMMSPPSGYSSDDAAGAPFANEQMLSAVKQEVERLKRSEPGDAAAASGSQQEAGKAQAAPPQQAEARAGEVEEQPEAASPEPKQQPAVEKAQASAEQQPAHQQQHSPQRSHGSPTRPQSRLAVGSKSPENGAPAAAAAAAGSDASGAESSSDLSDSDSATASSSAAPLPASAQLPPLPPPPAHQHHAARAPLHASAAAAEAAAAAAVAAASSAAKASILAEPAKGPLEDMLLDNKYTVAASESVAVLKDLEAERQAPLPDRAQHAAAVRRRSPSAQGGGGSRDGTGESGETEGAAAAAAPAAAGVSAGVEPVEKAAVAEDGAAAEVDLGGGSSAASSTKGEPQAPAAAAAQQPATEEKQPAAEGKQQQPQLEQQRAESSASTSSSEGEEEVTSPMKHPAGLLASSLKAHDQAIAAAAAAAAAGAVKAEAVEATPAGAAVDKPGTVTPQTAAAEAAAPVVAEAAAAAPLPAPAAAAEALPTSPGAPQPASQPVPIALPHQQQQDKLELPLGVSPGDAGYMADSEGPRDAPAPGAAPAPSPTAPSTLPQAHSGAMALGGQGFHMSLCGHLLRRGTPAAEALQVFEANRVTAAAWAAAGGDLLADPSLVVRVAGTLYPWSAAGPMVLGMLAFGGPWQEAAAGPPADEEAWHPLRVAEERQGPGKKGDGTWGATPPAGSSWRLWPFSGWRDGAGSGAGGKPPGAGGAAVGGTSPVRGASKSAGGAPGADGAAGARPGSSPPPLGGLLSGLSLPLSRAGSLGGTASAGPTSPRRTTTDGGAQRPPKDQQPPLPPAPRPRRHIVIIRKTLMPTPDQLASLPLRFGSNTISFRCNASGSAPLTAYVYYYPWNARLVISDVDGTITRSDLLGHVLPTLGLDWSHAGITQLFHNIAANGYQIMFLSSRAISQANITREYLHKLSQNGYKMPTGPVIISPHGLLPSLYRCVLRVWVGYEEFVSAHCLPNRPTRNQPTNPHPTRAPLSPPGRSSSAAPTSSRSRASRTSARSSRRTGTPSTPALATARPTWCRTARWASRPAAPSSSTRRARS
jgi:hypothetical protein